MAGRPARSRRATLAGLSLALGACAAPGLPGSPGGAPAGSTGRHGATVTGFIPTTQEPRPDDRLTLIWFYEPE
jgi:hypothetical protein